MTETETETQELSEVISDALALIDRGLTGMLHRELISTDEVANLLLDVRTLLSISELEELEELEESVSPN